MTDYELKNCSFVRNALMIIIVAYHSIIFLSGNWFNDAIDIGFKSLAIEYLCNWLNSFHVYAFTFMSGYIFYYIKYEKGGYQNYRLFLANKVKRLLIPYLFVSLFWAIPIHSLIYGFDFSQIAYRFILGAAPNQLWFLLMLFFVFAIFFPLSKVFKEKKASVLLVILFAAIGIVLNHYFPNVLQIWSSLRFITFFYLGFKTRQSWRFVLKKIPFLFFVVFDVVLFVGSCFLQTQTGSLSQLLNVFLLYVINIVGSFMAWTSLQHIAKYFSNNKVNSFFAQRSMIVFLFHQQVIYIVIGFLFNEVNIFLIAFFNFLFSLSFSLLISVVFLRFNWTRFLIGEKPKKNLT